MTNTAAGDLRRMLIRGAAWRLERVGPCDGALWSVVVSDEQHRRIGAYASRRFTSYDATREWLRALFRDAIDWPEPLR